MQTQTLAMPDLITTKEVADILRVDEDTVRRWMKNGALEFVALPRIRANYQTYRVKRSTVEKILNTPIF